MHSGSEPQYKDSMVDYCLDYNYNNHTWAAEFLGHAPIQDRVFLITLARAVGPTPGARAGSVVI